MKILRVNPEHFDVLYAINPHMKPGSVNLEEARLQWEDLGRVYEKIGVECEVIPGQAGLPDMVFSANQSLPFFKNGKPCVVLSNMAHPERQPEVEFFKEWYEKQGYEIFSIPKELDLEGMGDFAYSKDWSRFFAAFGF
jgi:N-dimethylarginine dimethylaminohydrolase